MELPPPKELLARIRALPGASLLLPALGSDPPFHLVGGAVRDILLGREPRELDVLVEGDALALARRVGGIVRAHDRFGTATVIVDGHRFDIARTRRETYPRPGALPAVEPAGLAEDLRRRDFTVNTGAVALTGDQPGRFSAVEPMLHDLQGRRLRVLHDRSFIDDPTRLLRLARYASRLGFEAEPRTRALAEAAVREGALRTVSGSRIGAELRLLAGEPDPDAALALLAELGLGPALGLDTGSDTRSRLRQALTLLPDDERRDRLVLGAMVSGAPAERLRSQLDDWGFEAADRDVIASAATGAPALAAALERAANPSEVGEAARAAPAELVALAGALGPEARARDWLERLRHFRLEIGGDDLIAAGIPPGEAIGRGLRTALSAKLNDEASGRDQELAAALRAARASQ